MNNLQIILEDLKLHKNPKENLLYSYINKRLNKSLLSYYKELQTSIKFLNLKQDNVVMNGLNNL